MSDRIFRVEQPDGTHKQYDVSKLSEDAQRSFYLLQRTSQKLQDVSDTYLMLKESEAGLIQKITAELSDEMLVVEQTDGSEDEAGAA